MLPKRQKLRAFFNCWTIKEAYSKAVGTGLTEPSNLFDLLWFQGEPTIILNTKRCARGTSRWSKLSFTHALDFTATLVVEGHKWHLQCFQFVPENKLI